MNFKIVSFPLVGRDFLRSDSICVTLIRTMPNGREKILGYYTNVENALVGYMHKKIKENNSQSINSLVLAIKSLHRALTCPKHIAEIEAYLKKEENKDE